VGQGQRDEQCKKGEIYLLGNYLAGKKVTEAVLLENGYQKYSGERINVYFHQEICSEIGHCMRTNPDVFEKNRKPWICPNYALIDQVIAGVNACPTGALKYLKKSSESGDTYE
jgi:uncharacterized Fe-S cluster protein YjdI